MNLTKNLRYLRLKNGFSQEYLAEKFDYKSYTTIQKWETGLSEPPLKVAVELAKIYNVTIDDLFSVDLEFGEANKEVKKIPILGTIAAGVPILATENHEDHFYIDSKINADFALKIKGDSMIEADIFENDIVFIRKQSTLENGEIGAVLLDDEATLKRFYKNNGSITLQAENPKYAPRTFTNGNISILGKLVAVLNMK